MSTAAHPVIATTPATGGGLEGAVPSLEDLIALRGNARHLEWLMRQRVRTARSGTRLSRFRGRGIDFAEVRVYEPGDDVRHIDWRVTARTGTPHTKLFQEERERPILVLADLGPGSFFGTRRRMKSVAIAELSALLLWRAFDHGDRVGALIRDADDHQAFRPRHDRRTLLRILARLADSCTLLAERFRADAPAAPAVSSFSLADALTQIRRVARPGSRVLILSDFGEPGDLTDDGHGAPGKVARNLRELGRHCDLEVLHISDPFERELPPAGVYPLTDGAHRRLIDTAPTDTRRQWQQHHAERVARLDELVRSARGRLGSFSTDDDLAQGLGAWLR
ncbi:MAG: DUF58 domain-containing protein [Gammaproteobacteria bacterium]|nr:DUF58 domain-containing protein [Gammaproteobacteria bacterium]